MRSPLGRRPRPRHTGFRTREDLRALLPPRLGVAPPDPGCGHRSEYCEIHCRGPRRPGVGAERRWPGEPFYHRVALVTSRSEIRKPKTENRMKAEAQNPKPEARGLVGSAQSDVCRPSVWTLDFRL